MICVFSFQMGYVLILSNWIWKFKPTSLIKIKSNPKRNWFVELNGVNKMRIIVLVIYCRFGECLLSVILYELDFSKLSWNEFSPLLHYFKCSILLTFLQHIIENTVLMVNSQAPIKMITGPMF